MSSGASGQAAGILSSVSCSNWKSTRLAPATATPRTTPRPSTSKLRFVPCLPRSVGFAPVCFPAERRFRQRPVHRLIGPLNLRQFVIVLQTERPELRKHPCLRPLLETPMGRTAGTDAGGAQRVPLTARAQHEADGIQD